MKEYDVIVIGSGAGLSVMYKALSANLKVALVAKQYLGGTCLNVGCVPSKMLIYPADRIAAIEESAKLGISATVTGRDFAAVTARARETIRKGSDFIREDIRSTGNLDFYETEGHFVGDYTLEVAGERIRGEKIFIASGARPLIPPIKGLAEIDYLTNETILELSEPPESMLIIGGSYIGVEYAHFFSSMGTEVTVVELGDRLVAFEEPEISDLLKRKMEARMKVYTGSEVVETKGHGSGTLVLVKDRKSGSVKELNAATVLVAAGRVSNADTLKLQNTGVETAKGDFIRVNEYLETSKPNIWAIGDATGRQMFTHAGDKESEIAWHNAVGKEKVKMDFEAVPHAVFTHPQIASIGLTEEAARKGHALLVGRAGYSDVVQGDAMMEEDGFAKAIVEKGTDMILGFHIIGPEASILIQEVVNAVVNRYTVHSITDSMHIFPALSELVPEALNNLQGDDG
jgi:mycothione reductase